MHMDGRFNNPFISEQEDHHQQQQSPIATNSSSSYSPKFSTSMSSPKKGRRAVQKRVVSVPIGEIDGSRCKGEGAPPSDSWAWRKYGQKPIKGSPFPRGYYRCSSSKGCPARKQVERSRLDPSMLLITYACEHNHPWPASKRSNPTTTSSAATTTSPPTSNTTDDTSNDKLDQEESPVFTTQSETKPDDKFPNLGTEDSMMTTDDFGWFSDVASTSLTILESPIYSKSSINGEQDDLGLLRFPNMREEDESLFADLGELPECSLVFRRGYADQEEERRRCNLRAASWCGSTG